SPTVSARITVAAQTTMLLRSSTRKPRSTSTSTYGCSVGASGYRLSVAWNSSDRPFSEVASNQYSGNAYRTASTAKTGKRTRPRQLARRRRRNLPALQREYAGDERVQHAHGNEHHDG